MKRLVQYGAHAIVRIDWWLVGAIIFLCTVGVLMQYTIGLNQEIPDLGGAYKHMVFISIGAVLFAGAFFIEPRQLKLHPFMYALLAVLLLIAVLIFGQEIKGTTGWFILFGFSFQPVELVKVLFILFMASYVQKDATVLYRPRYFLTSAGVIGIILGLVILQPDLGSAAVLASLWFWILVIVRVPKRYIAAVIGVGVVAFLIGWFGLFEQYQRDRLTTFLNPEENALTTGYNITQSIVAVGSGQLWGKGLGFGTQSQLHFLPEVASDFIFAAIAEELGFIGVVLLISAFAIIVWRLWIYARRAEDYYAFIFLIGVIIYITFQSVLVMGMNIGLMPVTGLPLPLVSRGGSSMVVTLLLLGIAHRMGMRSMGE